MNNRMILVFVLFGMAYIMELIAYMVSTLRPEDESIWFHVMSLVFVIMTFVAALMNLKASNGGNVSEP